MNTKPNISKSTMINTIGIKKRRSSMTAQLGEDVES